VIVGALVRARAWASDVRTRVRRARVFDSAAASAFWLFLALLPLAVVCLMVITKVAAANASVLALLVGAVPAAARSLVTRELAQVAAWHGGTVGPASAIVFVWLASSGVHGILDAFDATLDVERSWWKKRVVSIAICVGLSVVIGLAGLAFGLLGQRATYLLMSTPARWVVALACEVVLVAGLFGAGMPRGEGAPRRRWPGALLATLLQTLLGWGFLLYFRWLGRSSAYATATLATVGATMIVMYLFTLSLLLGVAFNVAVGGRHEAKRAGSGALPQIWAGRVREKTERVEVIGRDRAEALGAHERRDGAVLAERERAKERPDALAERRRDRARRDDDVAGDRTDGDEHARALEGVGHARGLADVIAYGVRGDRVDDAGLERLHRARVRVEEALLPEVDAHADRLEVAARDEVAGGAQA
jgi:membrane protein